MKARIRINHQITAPTLRVIDETGANLGVLSLSEALNKAIELGSDLIEVSAAANPPVAKIMDYGKFQYLENKKQKQARTNAHQTETKSLQVKIGTGDHDLEIKAAKASAFLGEGHRVKLELYLRGRAKYFDQEFLRGRLDRLMKFITVNYRIASGPERGPKGLSLIIERVAK